MLDFSIIIPVYNESGNIKNLIQEIKFNVDNTYNYEIIIIDDCSKDSTSEVLHKLHKKNINIFRNNENKGQSFSLTKGIKKAKSLTIITIDGDGQNDPLDINNLAKLYFANQGLDMVGGIRKNRKDNWIKIISSKLANNIRQVIFNDKCSDTGCSLKIFKKDIFLKFPYFNGIHRFLPALFSGYGHKSQYIYVNHRPRLSGESNYGTIGRLFRGIIDIIKVKIIIYRSKND